MCMYLYIDMLDRSKFNGVRCTNSYTHLSRGGMHDVQASSNWTSTRSQSCLQCATAVCCNIHLMSSSADTASYLHTINRRSVIVETHSLPRSDILYDDVWDMESGISALQNRHTVFAHSCVFARCCVSTTTGCFYARITLSSSQFAGCRRALGTRTYFLVCLHSFRLHLFTNRQPVRRNIGMYHASGSCFCMDTWRISSSVDILYTSMLHRHLETTAHRL